MSDELAAVAVPSDHRESTSLSATSYSTKIENTPCMLSIVFEEVPLLVSSVLSGNKHFLLPNQNMEKFLTCFRSKQ